MAGDNGRSTGSTSLMVPSSTAAGENHARFLKCRPSLTLPFVEVPTLAHIRLTVTHCDPENPPMERTARVGPDLVVTLLRNWHGVVPEDLPRFSVERRETTHQRMRIMLIRRGDVKFKLFIACISKRRKWQLAATVRPPDGCAVSRHGHERNPFLTKLLSTMASAMSFMGLRICWLWRCRV